MNVGCGDLKYNRVVYTHITSIRIKDMQTRHFVANVSLYVGVIPQTNRQKFWAYFCIGVGAPVTEPGFKKIPPSYW